MKNSALSPLLLRKTAATKLNIILITAIAMDTQRNTPAQLSDAK